MNEYEQLDHMELVLTGEENIKLVYYLPHLPVLRIYRITTKLRVVFNASAKNITGHSLN